MVNISTFLQEKDFLPPLISIPFIESKQKKMNSLLEKSVFEVVFILKVPKNIKIFNFHFIDKIKNIGVANTFEKLRLII